MSHTVELDAGTGIVDVRLIAPISGGDLPRATAQAVTLQKQAGVTRCLVDADGWDIRASTVEIDDLVHKQYWDEALDRRSCIALVLPTSASARAAVQFYEDVCRNRGWNVQICSDCASAVDWLTAASTSP